MAVEDAGGYVTGKVAIVRNKQTKEVLAEVQMGEEGVFSVATLDTERKPKIKLFLGRHGNLEDAKKVFSACRKAKCDILLIEYIGWTQEFIDQFLPEKFQSIIKKGSKFHHGIFENFKNGGCPVYPIDLPAEHSLYTEISPLLKYINSSEEMPTKEVFYQFGQLQREREDYISENFERHLLSAKRVYKMSETKTIGVFFGATHTRLYHLLKKKYPVEVIYLSKPVFNKNLIIMRKGIFGIDL